MRNMPHSSTEATRASLWAETRENYFGVTKCSAAARICSLLWRRHSPRHCGREWLQGVTAEPPWNRFPRGFSQSKPTVLFEMGFRWLVSNVKRWCLEGARKYDVKARLQAKFYWRLVSCAYPLNIFDTHCGSHNWPRIIKFWVSSSLKYTQRKLKLIQKLTVQV